MDAVHIQDLLENAGWLRSLARSLVRDAAGAEDIVQQTWVAALERPPRSSGASGTWLRRVLRNLALRARRADGHRRLREERVARPEVDPVTPRELVEKAELHRRIVEEVIALDELELKSETMQVIEEGILTSEQRQVAFGHAVRHRLCDDWFSPVVMTSSSARPMSGGDPSSTIAAVKQRLAERYGLGGQDVESAGSDWLEALTPLLRPTRNNRGVTLEETIIAGRAQEMLLRTLLETAGDDIALRRRILEEVSWFVPRVVEE